MTDFGVMSVALTSSSSFLTLSNLLLPTEARMLTDIQLCMSMRLDSDHRLAFSDQRMCFWQASTRACFSSVRRMTYFRHQVAVSDEFFDLKLE